MYVQLQIKFVLYPVDRSMKAGLCFDILVYSNCTPPFASVCLSVCHKNFSLAHIFWNINDRALIFGIQDHCDKPFLLVPCDDLWPISRSNLLPGEGPQFFEFLRLQSDPASLYRGLQHPGCRFTMFWSFIRLFVNMTSAAFYFPLLTLVLSLPCIQDILTDFTSKTILHVDMICLNWSGYCCSACSAST